MRCTSGAQIPCVLNCATQTAQSDLSKVEPFGALCPILSSRFLKWGNFAQKTAADRSATLIRHFIK
jgi:hypothetical protein